MYSFIIVLLVKMAMNKSSKFFSTKFCMNDAGVNNLENGRGGRYAQSWTSKEGGLL